MVSNSKIEWTHHTFNPWRGCTKVSAGCKNCYADALSKRNPGTLGVWGPNGSRVVAAEAYWRQALKWNEQAACIESFDCGNGDHSDACPQSDRPRVFCASLADVFESSDTMPIGVYSEIRSARARLFKLIETTPNLDWLLLTKRPQNVMEQVREVYEDCLVRSNPWPLPNVWLGTSVENQQTADERIPHLLKCPAAVRFLSCEPLLGPISFIVEDDGMTIDALAGVYWKRRRHTFDPEHTEPDGTTGDRVIDLLIMGGESGSGARPCNLEWMRDMIERCRVTSAAPFVKQMGSNPVVTTYDFDRPYGDRYEQVSVKDEVANRDRKGGDMAEWPKDLRVRELPERKVVV